MVRKSSFSYCDSSFIVFAKLLRGRDFSLFPADTSGTRFRTGSLSSFLSGIGVSVSSSSGFNDDSSVLLCDEYTSSSLNGSDRSVAFIDASSSIRFVSSDRAV